MKKNKKKKAFTLIELLAVIIILAIISLIVTVSIGRLIDNARKETYKESVRGIIRSAELYMGKYVLANHKDPVYPIVFTCDGNTCSNGADKLDFNGEVPKSGTITLINHKLVKAEYLSSGKYCASGTKTELQVSKSCADIDITKPTVDGTLQGNILHLTLIDNESGIASYCVATSDSTNGCSWINTTNSNVEYTLSVSGTYYVFAKDKKDNISLGKEFITGDIEKPTVTAELDGKIIDIEVSDNASVVEYCAATTNDSTGCSWQAISTNSFGHTLSEAGTYYVFAKDSSGNISDGVEIIAPTTAFCAFEIGHTWDNFIAGQINSWHVPCSGIYKLEVWGAQGGGAGGKGGYAVGEKTGIIDEYWYIAVGAQGNTFNGGGPSAAKWNGSGANGGGATHICSTETILSGTSIDDLFIVAGGGGGQGYYSGTYAGGYGGGVSGGTGAPGTSSSSGYGATQTTGYAYGQGGGPRESGAGGGGGYYGGYGAENHSGLSTGGGGGGSAYIGGVANGSTIAGNAAMPTHDGTSTMTGNTGNGYAKITLISY